MNCKSGATPFLRDKCKLKTLFIVEIYCKRGIKSSKSSLYLCSEGFCLKGGKNIRCLPKIKAKTTFVIRAFKVINKWEEQREDYGSTPLLR